MSNLRKLAALLVGAALLAVVAIGCGGGDDDTSGTEAESSLSKAEFIKQGNAICKAGNDEIEEGFEEFAKENNLSPNKQPTAEQLEEVSEDVLIPVVSKEVEEIRDLGPPDSQGDEVITAAEEAVEEAEEDPSVMTAEGNDGPFTAVNKKARAYGLNACGEE